MKLFKKIGRTNGLLKPFSVILTAGGPLTYLLFQSSKLVDNKIDAETIAVGVELIQGLRGSIILGILLISILQIYKPPKSVVISLMVGGIMIFASSLFMTLGVTFLLYGIGSLINKMTLEKLIHRNNQVKELRAKEQINRIAGMK